jgi:hypothetical protein
MRRKRAFERAGGVYMDRNQPGFSSLLSTGSRRPRVEARMRKLSIALAALQFAVLAASAQPASQTAASNSDFLSMDQKVKIGAIITEKTPPLTNVQFSPVIDEVVPAQIKIQALPPGPEQLAPQLRGYGCIVFEELIAIVDQNTRKIATVIPRWR